jgi:hypothetical protein
MAKIDEELCEKVQRWMHKPQQRQECQMEDNGKDHRVGGRATMAHQMKRCRKFSSKTAPGTGMAKSMYPKEAQGHNNIWVIKARVVNCATVLRCFQEKERRHLETVAF